MPQESDNPSQPAAEPAPYDAAAAVIRRVRWLMLIAGLTTAIAIAAVAVAVGYRLYHSRESSGGTIVNGTVFLPKGAHVDSTTVADGRIVVTFDVNGASEVRMFDLKTLQLVGQLHFATER